MFRPEKASRVVIRLRGIDVAYDASKDELVIGNHRVSAPLQNGEQNLILVIDRTMLTVWGV